MVQDDRGWQRDLAWRRGFDPTGPGRSTVFPRLRPNGAATRRRSATRFRAIDLQSCGQLQSNGTRRRCVDAALLRLVEAAVQPRPNGAVPLRQRGSVSANQVRGAASLSMLWLGAAASTGWCRSLELAQSKKASPVKPTIFPASLPRPGAVVIGWCRSLELAQSKKATFRIPWVSTPDLEVSQ